MKYSSLLVSLICCPAILASVSATAQTADKPDEEIVLNKVKVIGTLDVKAADTQIKPEMTLDAEDVASYGASTIEELLEQLGPQVSSGRGRGSERPVILIDGVKVASFREIRNFPPEAIERIDVLPEEAALKYGYSANQRVINFILKDKFSAVSVEAELGGPVEGAGFGTELSANYLNIKNRNRTAFDTKLETDSGILEADRDVTNEQKGLPGWKDSLSAKSDTLTLGVSQHRPIGEDYRLTLSGDLELGNSLQYLGLAQSDFILPVTNPFATSTEDESFSRIYGIPGSMERDTETLTGNLNMTWTGNIGSWDFTSATSFGRTETTTDTDRTPDVTAYQDALNSLTDPVSPTMNISRYLSLRTEQTERITNTLSTNLLLKGSLFSLPAGNVNSSISADLSHSDRSSKTILDGITTETDLDRQIAKLQASADLPLISSDMDIPGFDTLGLNMTANMSDYSDFGTLYGFDGTLLWSPIEKLNLLGSYSYERGAPSMSQLGDTISITQNVDVFDYVTGESVLVTQTTGGNPDLEADTRKTFKASAELKPLDESDLRLRVEYIDSRIDDPIGSIGSIDAAIQTVFPDSFVRDAEGTLIAYDARTVNFKESTSRQIRWGFDWSKRIEPKKPAGGPPSGAAGRPMGAGAPGRPPANANAAPPKSEDGSPKKPGSEGKPAEKPAQSSQTAAKAPSAGPRPSGGGRGRRNPGARLHMSLYHTWMLESTRTLAEGYPVQDYLDGAAAGGIGGTPEHTVTLSGGYFNKGAGLWMYAIWRDGTDVLSDGASGNLSFSDLTTTRLRLFYTVQQGSYLARKVDWLQGSRFSIDFKNIFDERMTVRDETGVIPLRYESDRLDAEGRVIKISFRKSF